MRREWERELAAPDRFLLAGQVTSAFKVNSWAKRKAKKTQPFAVLSQSQEGASACNPSHAPCSSALRSPHVGRLPGEDSPPLKRPLYRPSTCPSQRGDKLPTDTGTGLNLISPQRNANNTHQDIPITMTGHTRNDWNPSSLHDECNWCNL